MSRIVELEKPDRAAGALSPALPTARRATRAHGLVSRLRPGSGPPLGRGALPRMRHDGGRDARPTSRPGSAGVDGDGAGGEPFGRVRARRARIGGLPNDRAGAVDAHPMYRTLRSSLASAAFLRSFFYHSNRLSPWVSMETMSGPKCVIRKAHSVSGIPRSRYWVSSTSSTAVAAMTALPVGKTRCRAPCVRQPVSVPGSIPTLTDLADDEAHAGAGEASRREVGACQYRG